MMHNLLRLFRRQQVAVTRATGRSRRPRAISRHQREEAEAGDFTNPGFQKHHVATKWTGQCPNHDPIGSIRFRTDCQPCPPS